MSRNCCQPERGLRVMDSVDGLRCPEVASEPPASSVVSGVETLSQAFATDYRTLVRLASTLLDTRDEGEEVVQEAFARTLAGWSRVRGKDDPGAYVRRAVVNLCHGRLRRRRIARRLRPETQQSALSAEQVVQAADMAERVRAAVRRLPVRQRE